MHCLPSTGNYVHWLPSAGKYIHRVSNENICSQKLPVSIAGKHLNPVPKLPKCGKTFVPGTMCGKACMWSYKVWKNTNGATLAGQNNLTQASGVKRRKSYDQRQLCRKMLVPDWWRVFKMNTRKCTWALYYVHAPQNFRASINTAKKKITVEV